MNVDRTSYFLVLNRECDTSSSFISSERGCVNPLNLTHFKPEIPPTLTNADTTMNSKLSLETLGDNGNSMECRPGSTTPSGNQRYVDAGRILILPAGWAGEMSVVEKFGELAVSSERK